MQVEEKKTEKPETVPYFVYEGTVNRDDKKNRRLFIALLIAIILLFASNMGWLIYESQYNTFSYSQDGNGLNNINTGTQGDVDGAEGESQSP